jgi:hypothetical protein
VASRRFLWLAAVVAVLGVAPAQAADVPVLQRDGSTVRRHDPGVAARDPQPLSTDRSVRAQRTASAAKATTAMSELKRFSAEGSIDPAVFAADRKIYRRARSLRNHTTGRRRIEMAGQLAVLNGIAARGLLTPSRVAPLWLQLDRNREWWGSGPLLASGQRVGFDGSEMLYQYVPGEGLQIHPLGNFGKLNGLAGAKGQRERMVLLLNELLAIRASRAGGVAWEYYFDFGGGRPPWVSGLAQGTALQAIARASRKSGDYDLNAPVLKEALAIFKTPTPVGVRVPAPAGIHYAQYSYAPSLRILNGFIQALTGLYDYATIYNDAEAMQLFTDGETEAAQEVPTYDTGAWSLYSRGSSTHESDLNYHVLLKDFLENLCDRTQKPVYCDTAANFVRYTEQGPEIKVLTRSVKAGKPSALRFSLSKISRVNLTLLRGGRSVFSYTSTLAYGTRYVSIKAPKGASSYEVRISATDLAGNSGSTAATVKIRR